MKKPDSAGYRRRYEQIVPIRTQKKSELELLLLADEQEDMIDRYLERGEMFALRDGEKVLAVIVVTDEGEGTVEIKNLAVSPSVQRRGYGRAMIDFVAGHYAGRYHTLLVGTGDSPMTVPFYEKCGFEKAGDVMTLNKIDWTPFRVE